MSFEETQVQPHEQQDEHPKQEVEKSTPFNLAALQFQGDLAVWFYERGQRTGQSFDDASKAFDAFWTEERKVEFRDRFLTDVEFAQLVLDRDLEGALEKMGLRLED